jgi:MFS family permease
MSAGAGQPAPHSGAAPGAWTTVGLLWFYGFFNYADRQAVFSVFPLLKDEFGLDDTTKGLIGSSFMVVYALASPFTGRVVDLVARRGLIVGGLARPRWWASDSARGSTTPTSSPRFMTACRRHSAAWPRA